MSIFRRSIMMRKSQPIPVVATPVITITDTTATITCATDGATIYYTLDGSTPTSASTAYSSAITLTQSCTIKAIATKSGMTDSEVASESYVHIQYLTAWRLVGNSSVHTDPYLTQWKVEGNSVVDNNAILSCGDLGQDGYYHVKISNGVSIFDIPLTEPLRKVNSVADTIEFANGVAILTRYLGTPNWQTITVVRSTSPVVWFQISESRMKLNSDTILSSRYPTYPFNTSVPSFNSLGIGGHSTSHILRVVDEEYSDLSANDFLTNVLSKTDLIFELETPTTETIEVSPFPISSNDTYTSQTEIAYSAFTFTKNSEIWSCGELGQDTKYHIYVQSNGKTFDIALTEPLRKVNDVADKLEFANSIATVTRHIGYVADISTLRFAIASGNGYYSRDKLTLAKSRSETAGLLNPLYEWNDSSSLWVNGKIGLSNNLEVCISERVITDIDEFNAHIAGSPLIYELATPTTETITVPEIEVSSTDTYTQVISQGAKAVSWSSFTPNTE